MVYWEIYIFSLSSVPGTELLKPMKFPEECLDIHKNPLSTIPELYLKGDSSVTLETFEMGAKPPKDQG